MFHCLLFGFRYRQGFLERIDEYVALFAVCWMSVWPLLIFQALLSARDDHLIKNRGNDSPTATEVVAPLIFILGWILLALTVVSWKYRTAFEVLQSYLPFFMFAPSPLILTHLLCYHRICERLHYMIQRVCE